MYKAVFLKHLLAIIICCVAMQIKGQVTLGIRTGYTMAWKANVTWDDDEAYIHNGGFQISLLSYFNISRTISLGLEPGFVQRVTSIQTLGHFGSFESRVLLNYLELPLMVSAKYPLWNDRWEMNVKAGYGIAYLLSAFRGPNFLTGEDPMENKGFDFKVNCSQTFNIDHGLHGGFGIAYKIHNSRLFLETDYYMGFQDVSQSNTSKNRSVHFGAGYKIVF